MENARDMNGLLKDAFKLSVQIFDSLSPSDKYVIVNIAKTTNSTFTYPANSEIPTSYGYLFDKTPQVLIEEKVFIVKEKNKWWIGNDKIKQNTLDLITIMARSKGYLNKDEWAHYYSQWIYDHYNYGPTCSGLYVVLIDVLKLKEFINKLSGALPVFNEATKSLEFLGQTVLFSGELMIKSVKLLIANINSLVTKEEFYELGEHGNYKTYAKQKKLTKINDTLKKRFEDIQSKIWGNEGLKTALVLVNNRQGIGMFINNRIFLSNNSQKSE